MARVLVHQRAREIIDRQTGQMVRMIDDLLEASRVTQGQIRVRLERTDLISVLKAAAEATEPDRERRNQKLVASLPKGPAWIDGDAVRLEQVFVNLLHNANKFSPDKRTIWLTFAVEGETGSGGLATVRVRDEGAGIEASALPRIFDLFVQGDRRSARNRSGLGIGLTLARQLIEMHGGTVEVSSAGPSQGTEFVVRLPLKLAPGTAAKSPVANERETSSQAKRGNSAKRILIIDDDSDGGEAMKLLLKHSGHEVEVASDGESALEHASRFRPDATLVDIGLPNMDGYEVVRELRKRPDTRQALMIAVTGFGADSDIRKSQEAGFDEHMIKPVNLDVLLARLDAPD